MRSKGKKSASTGRKRSAKAKTKVTPESEIPLTYLRGSGRTVTWEEFLKSVDNLTKVPPVSFFPKAPLSKCWDEIAKVGLAVELRNPFYTGVVDIFWVGTIVYYAGYFALVQLETFGTEPTWLAWVTFASDAIRPLGWCQANARVLYPGKEIAQIHPDYMEKLVQWQEGKKTISDTHVQKVCKEIDDMSKFDPSLPVEATNISDGSESRIARIVTAYADQFGVQYIDLSVQDGTGNLVCGNPRVNHLHPLGFSSAIGLPIFKSLPGLVYPWLKGYKFPDYPPELKIRTGMSFETRHPDFPFKIVAAVVTRVLRKGYFIAETCDLKEIQRSKFYTSITSPLLFPSGWGHRWEITVEDYRNDQPRDYLPLHLLPQRLPHSFQPGMVVEARDTSEKAFFGAAVIQKVADHMLHIHFLNWDKRVEKNYAWVDAEFGEIYPIGYTELFGLEFQGHA